MRAQLGGDQNRVGHLRRTRIFDESLNGALQEEPRCDAKASAAYTS